MAGTDAFEESARLRRLQFEPGARSFCLLRCACADARSVDQVAAPMRASQASRADENRPSLAALERVRQGEADACADLVE